MSAAACRAPLNLAGRRLWFTFQGAPRATARGVQRDGPALLADGAAALPIPATAPPPPPPRPPLRMCPPSSSPADAGANCGSSGHGVPAEVLHAQEVSQSRGAAGEAWQWLTSTQRRRAPAAPLSLLSPAATQTCLLCADLNNRCCSSPGICISPALRRCPAAAWGPVALAPTWQ